MRNLGQCVLYNLSIIFLFHTQTRVTNKVFQYFSLCRTLVTKSQAHIVKTLLYHSRTYLATHKTPTQPEII